MLTNTITLSGSVVVEGVAFSWWVTDGLKPQLTVSNGVHGTKTQSLGATKPQAQARDVARAMLAAMTRTIETHPVDDLGSTIVLGED